MITLSDVRVFYEIVQAQGFTGAARKLNLPKSSVARQLSRLEGELGCRLFNRTTRKVTLSDDGRTFLPYARRLLEDEEEAVEILRAGGEEAKGLLSISASYTFGRHFLAPELDRFRRRYPNVRLMLDLTSRRVDLTADEIDVAVRIGPPGDTECDTMKIGSIGFGLAASPTYLEARPKLGEPRDVEACNFLELRPPAGGNRIDLYRENETATVGCAPVIRSNDPDCLRQACVDGAGICALPLFLIEADLKRGALVLVLPDWVPKPAPVHLLAQRRNSQPARVRVFLEFIRETAAQNARWASLRDHR